MQKASNPTPASPFSVPFRPLILPFFLAIFLFLAPSAAASEDPSPAVFAAEAAINCGELRVSARGKPGCVHTWLLTVGSQTFSASGSATFSQPLRNINTYALGQATLTHTVDCNGVVTALTQTVSLPPGIFVGQDEAQTLFTVISPFDGQPLFPGASMLGRDVYAMGTLSLDKPAFNFVSCDLFMRACAAIEVPGTASAIRTLSVTGGSVLYNDESSLFGGPSSPSCALWRGIEVRGTGRLYVEGSSIHDALFGVNLVAAEPNLMPLLSLHEAKFYNNFIGLNMVGQPKAALVPLIVGFSGNVFTNTRPLQSICENSLGYYALYGPTDLPAYNNTTGFAGIHARFASFVLPAAEPYTGFSNLANGMVLDDANAGNSTTPVRYCRFNNMALLPSVNPSGNGIYFIDRSGVSNFLYQQGVLPNFGPIPPSVVPDFFNCEYAVFARTNAVRSFVRCQGNVMDGVTVGVRLFSDKASFDNLSGEMPSASNNRIFARRHGIHYTHLGNVTTRFNFANDFVTLTTTKSIGILVEHVGPAAAGNIHNISIGVPTIHAELGRSAIELRNTRGVFVNGYIGDGGYNEFVSPKGNGVWLSNCYNSHIVFNRVLGTYPADEERSHGIRSEWGGDNIIGENDLVSTAYGIRFTGSGSANVYCNAMAGNYDGLRYDGNAVTGAQYIRRNRWDGPFDGLAARHIDSDAEGLWQASIYTVAPVSSALFAPTSVTPLSWFVPLSVFPQTCLALASEPFGRTDFDAKAATTGFPFPSYAAEQNWTARRFLYGKLKAWPALVNDTMQAFLNGYASSSLGRLADLAQDEAAALQISPSDTAAWQFNQEALARRLGQIAAIDSNFMAAAPPPNEAQLLAERAQILGWAGAHQQANFAIDSLHQAQVPGLVAAFEAENSAISATLDCDAHEKTLQGIWLGTAALGGPVSQGQLATIAAIAQDCPDRGGTAVFWARVWYEHLTGEELEIRDTCAPLRGDRSLSAQSSKLSAYPNPATESLTVLLPEGFAGGRLQLFSPLGRLVAEVRPAPGAGSAQMDLRGLSPGIYVLRAGAETLKIAVTGQ